MLAARVMGCGTIIALDVIDARLSLAKAFGATHVINTRQTADIKKAIMDIGGITFAFDTTGSVRLMETAVSCLQEGGRGCGVAAAGMPRLDKETAARGITWSEIIQGHAIPGQFIPHMIGLYKKGVFPFDKMITFFDFNDINKAFSLAEVSAVIKPVVVM